MKLKSRWLALAASAAALVVFAYGGAALAQAPTGTPGETNPPGWKPHVAYPFSHVTPGQWAHPGKPGPRIEFPQGRQPPPSAAYTPSPEEQRELRREEEQTRKYGHITVEPPHPAKHWGTANGRPPERYHRTAPPTPSSGGREIEIGKSRIALTIPAMRCVMTTLEQPGLRKDSTVLRTIVRDAAQNLGIYATVAQPGKITLGDPATLL